MSHAVAATLPRTAVPYLVIGLGAIVALYGPIFPALVYEWATFPSLSHGFTIPLIVAYLVLDTAPTLAGIGSHPTWSGLPIVVAGLLLYATAPWAGAVRWSRMSFPLKPAAGCSSSAGRRRRGTGVAGGRVPPLHDAAAVSTVERADAEAIVLDVLGRRRGRCPWLGCWPASGHVARPGQHHARGGRPWKQHSG